METKPSELNFSLAQATQNITQTYIDFFLVLPFLFSPSAVPLSTSKPQKPMNKSNPKQIKPTLQRVLLLHWSDDKKPHVWSNFHRLKLSLPGFGQNRCLGCWFLHHCFFLPLEWQRETTRPIQFPSLETFAAWVWSESALGFAGFCIIASFFFVVHLCILISGISPSLRK